MNDRTKAKEVEEKVRTFDVVEILLNMGGFRNGKNKYFTCELLIKEFLK